MYSVAECSPLSELQAKVHPPGEVKACQHNTLPVKQKKV